MKLPWVSRIAYESLDAHHLSVRGILFAQISEVAADLRVERDRYNELLEKYTSLKMVGAVEVPTPEPITSTAQLQQPDEMRELIDQQCGSNYRKRAGMLRQLAADRANGVDDDKIRDAILNGVPSEGVPA